MSDDALRDSVPYSLLARILRKVQGVRDAETFAQVDVGEEVRRLNDAFGELRAENTRLRAQLARRDALVERLRREAEIHAQEARSSEREACAREVCMYCDGRAPRYGPPAGPNRARNYEHQHEESGRTVLCYASGIWSRHR